jgi:hypothetical protein
MAKFSQASKSKLATADRRLQELFNLVIKEHDCTVLYGHRSNEEQDELYRKGLSKLKGGQSSHNSNPSRAVDVVAYPINWKDYKRHYHFAGIVLGIASQLGIKIRWGGDWDMDDDLNDQTFNDLVHFEVIE